MKKNLFDINAANSVISRSGQLKSNSTNLWGEMNATEMLLHCNSCNRQNLEESRGNEKTTFKQLLLRILALYVAPDFKKGIKGEETHNTKGKIDSSCFEEQRVEFINLIKRFPENKKRADFNPSCIW
ncbi:MAG: hypothetical protein J7604_14285 [Sporocytophaga sp.]|uniref:hypothetical protein n=1 Tax=Sporocytophaga sp. TaxID=2231183 RepID=UPI001B26FCFD|nr:hypothetical protein [Sporocytophaga sp.]MBO9701374.1 hypothetical protein [Sporocytophaga sp.]